MKATFFFNSMDKEVEMKMSYEMWLTFMSVLQDVACEVNDSETWQNAHDYLEKWKQVDAKYEYEWED